MTRSEDPDVRDARGSRARAGDVEISEWCAEMWPRLVRSVSVWCNSRWEAEDLAQEALSRAVAQMDRTGEMVSPAWVTTVAMNLARSRLRRIRTERRPHPLAGERVPGSGEALSSDVLDALRALPRRQRQAIALRYLGDLSVDETATVMSCQASTVKAHVRDALAALRSDPRIVVAIAPEDP